MINIRDYLMKVEVGDGQWRGDLHTFLVHWDQQARLYNETKPNNDQSRINEATMIDYLERSVRPLPELRCIKTTARQISEATNSTMSYDLYMSLLLEAAAEYDLSQRSKVSKRRLQAHQAIQSGFLTEYEAMMYVQDGQDDVYSSQHPEGNYDVDTSVDTIIANAARQMPRSNPVPSSRHSANSSARLPGNVFSQLGPEGQRAWIQMPEMARLAITRAVAPQGNQGRIPPVSVNQHMSIPSSASFTPAVNMGSDFASQLHRVDPMQYNPSPIPVPPNTMIQTGGLA